MGGFLYRLLKSLKEMDCFFVYLPSELNKTDNIIQ